MSDASSDVETVCQCNHLTNFALLMAEGNGAEGALAAATGGVDRGVIALQVFSYVVVILAILCLLAVAYKVSMSIYKNCSAFISNENASLRPLCSTFFSLRDERGSDRNESLKI